jgi:hypothetical protein
MFVFELFPLPYALFIGEKENDVDSVFRTNTSQFSLLLNWICLHWGTRQREGEKEQNVSRKIWEYLRTSIQGLYLEWILLKYSVRLRYLAQDTVQ